MIEDDTRLIYNEEYFEGDRAKSNYAGYAESSFGPSNLLGDLLSRFFRPLDSLDVGCAVGHTVKKLRDLGTRASGVDISDWAVEYANVPYVRQFDFSTTMIQRQYDLVHSYDVVEHIPENRLQFAINNLWQATRKDLLLVPATYENGETFDPHEPTHLIFQPYAWWVDFVETTTGAKFDRIASERFAQEEHSQTFGYSHRIMIFTRLDI